MTRRFLIFILPPLVIFCPAVSESAEPYPAIQSLNPFTYRQMPSSFSSPAPSPAGLTVPPAFCPALAGLAFSRDSARSGTDLYSASVNWTFQHFRPSCSSHDTRSEKTTCRMPAALAVVLAMV